jgi:Asp-tRNA(Asn)/Glu-tRNA(Gln) amidotransferase A subunit family amidase
MRCALAGQPYVPLEPRQPRSLRVAACITHEWSALDDSGAQAWERGLARLEAAGVPMRWLDMPQELAGLLQAQKTVMAWEAARNLATEFREHHSRLSKPIVELVQLGMGVPDTQYQDALALARRGREQVQALMQGFDALLVPAAPGEAPHGLAATGDPVFSRVWTLLGLPCVNVPGLLGPNGMPVGLQLVGHRGQERALLAAAACVHAAAAA